MASLIDLFKGSPFEDDLNSNTDQNFTPASEAFPGSEYDVVKTDTETFIEQETTGLRVMSAVELNNPLIYGNEAIRIVTKSTPTLDTMKAETQGELPSGGLLGKGLAKLSGGKLTSISDVRNKINDFIGIPSPLIPTRVASKLESGLTVQEVLDQKNGTELGKFLKQTGGGNPSTIARQALGTAIEIAKDKATKFLLGTPGEIGQNLPLPTSDGVPPARFVGETDATPYSEYTKEVYTELDGQDLRTKEELNVQYGTRFPTRGIDLAYHSPIYGVERGSKLDSSDLGFQTKKNSTFDSNTDGLTNYDSQRTYSETGKDGSLIEDSLEVRYGLTNESDRINSTGINDSYESKELEKSDLISFWISKIGKTKRTHFRTLISGLSENVTPSWNSSKFFGNPYNYYTYGGVERNLTFNLFIYCSNPTELAKNWEKINKLTQYTYPSLNQGEGLINPPIIEFRLGNIYNEKVGYIESLSYTFPDNGTWETDLEGFQLPKFIDVNITIKLIEQIGSENNLYSYEKSKEALNELNSQNSFSTETADGSTSNKANKLGDPVLKLNIPSKPIKQVGTGIEQTLPSETNLDIPTKIGESGISEKSDAELTKIYEIETKQEKVEKKNLGKTPEVPLKRLQDSLNKIPKNILNRG